ncbi:DMSO/selenate family reductase complex A subunit [Neobacillus sp. LXY-4]|uniref:DMSO/selenate family reductase complex A subunit n=1 Tax=Neobacillus sp. LXY-4 TaxID=3379826 RepID=UPI003EE259C8
MSDKKPLISTNMKRRTFLKWTGAAAVPVIAGGIGTKLLIDKKEVKSPEIKEVTETVVSTCSVNNCGGKCVIKAHVRDGVVVRISTDTNKGDDLSTPALRACVRGRSYRSMLYHPDRLKYPMKRVGKRGEGKFERISWEEAVDTIASEMKRIGDKYGPDSRYANYASGNQGLYAGRTCARRLMALTGGFLHYRNDYSSGASNVATPYTYGSNNSGNSYDSLLHSKYIILWGQNPAEIIFSTPYRDFLLAAKKNGTKIVVIDPRYTDTVVAFADEWIPILPTTDNAMMDAMGYVIITENLHDQAFLDQFCVGFDSDHMPDGVDKKESLKSYLLGEKDGIAKTPEWAEKITRVPAEKIRQIAREYATAKPAALIQGWGPQRHAYGEQVMRGGAQLACLTGNVGKLGGWAAGTGYSEPRSGIVFPITFENPIKATIPCYQWTEAVERGTELTAADGLQGADKLNTNIKLIFNMAGNMLINQHSDINRTHKLLVDESKVEFIVASDIFMTPSMKYADIILPATTFFERYDIGTPWGTGDYVIFGDKVIDPLFECRNEYDVFAEIADKLGVKDKFTEGKTALDWVKESIKRTKEEMHPDFPTFEEFRKMGVYYFKHDAPNIAFQKQIEDPANNKFETPSGKIELFSKALYDMNNPKEIPAIAKYVPAWEGPEDPLKETYPLQLISWHYKRRVHSTHDNNPWLEEAAKQEMWLNPVDAKARSIKDGDRARVFNGRGELEIDVKVTSRIMPGVAAIPQGGWYTPNEKGIDQRGSVNVLTKHHPTPLAKANPQLTNLVQIERA